MNPYRTAEVGEVQKNEYNGHLFALSRMRLKKQDKIQYACVCVHCGKSVKINKGDNMLFNMLFNPSFRIHFKKQCPRTTKIKWQYKKKQWK